MTPQILQDRGVKLCILLIAFVALVAAMRVAQPILAPTVLGLVVGIFVSPLVDRLDRLGLSRVLLSMLIMVFTMAAIIVLFLALGPFLDALVASLPKIRSEVSAWLEMMQGALRGIERVGQEIEATVGETTEPVTSIPSLTDALWIAPNMGAKVLIFAGVLFFFTLTRPDLYAQAGKTADRLFTADKAVARYFATVTVINSLLGLAVAAALSVIGIPGALVWGLAAALLNFVLYLGPIAMVIGLTVAGLTVFSGFASLLPPAIFLILNLLEAQFITPALLGERLSINPLALFLAIVFGLWVWGPIGAIVAIPVLVWISTLLEPQPDPISLRRERSVSV